MSKTTGGSSSVWVGGATSGSGGRYEVQGLEAGHYKVAVRADGYARTSHEDRDSGVGGHTVDFVVDPAGRVQVRVLRPDGEPAKGVKLRALDPSGSRLRMETRFGAMTEISVNDRGEATLRGLPATTVQLLAVRGDFHPAGHGLLDLTPEVRVSAEATLHSPGVARAA